MKVIKAGTNPWLFSLLQIWVSYSLCEDSIIAHDRHIMAKPSTIEAQKLGIVKPLDPQPGAFRLEIDEFVQKPDVLNLFLLALESLQDNEQLKKFKELGDDATDKDKEKYWWSFFSIGGDEYY